MPQPDIPQSRRSEVAEPPTKGSRWRHPEIRGTWRVRTVGWKWITLTPPYLIHGYPNTHSVLRSAWPEGWEAVE